MSVPNSNPPMIEAANEPNIASGNSGIIPRIVVSEDHHHRTETTLGAIDQRSDRFYSLADLQRNFIHQHNSVLYNHTDQSQCADNRHKIECLPGQQHHGDYTDKTNGMQQK